MPPSKNSQQKPYEPLSHREQEILALLVRQMSDREIASNLFIAYTTVKWYNRQIFNKLGVENRRQAVERAISLGLVESTKLPNISKQSLPSHITPFVGRIHEIGELTQLLGDPSIRLITLLAPGGMGKTRLALQVADVVREQFSEGVCFVPLTSLTSDAHLLAAIADNTGFHYIQDSRPPKQQLLDFLGQKHLLLILDNFEQLVASAPLVSALLKSASRVKVLITSREKLNIVGETVYRVGGMPYPDQSVAENFRDYAAVDLFLQSAFRASPHFVIEDERALLRICQLVQGMPLALELAASWVSTLPLGAIAAEISRSIDFLQTTMRDVPERLRSIRAIFDATWLRLTYDEQRIFRRLSVFQGGCSRSAAEAVIGANINTLAGLVAKALLWYKPESARYEIHELLRQYAAEQLHESGETEQTENQHRQYFGELAREWGRNLKTSQQLTALETIEADYENIRGAFERAIQSRQVEFVEPFAELWNFYEISGRFPEGASIFEVAIEALEGKDSITLGKLLAGQGLFFERYAWFEKCHASAEKSVAMLRRLGASSELPMPMMVLGDAIHVLQNPESAMPIYQEAFALAQDFHDTWAESLIRYLFGNITFNQQHFDEAREHYSKAYMALKEAGNIWGISFCLNALARLALLEEEYAQSKWLFEDGLFNARKVNHISNIQWALSGLMHIAYLEGDLIKAKHYGEDALKIQRDIGWHVESYYTNVALAQIAINLGNLAEARQFILDALALSREIDENGILFVLLDAAELYLQTDRDEQAVEIASYIEAHSGQSMLDSIDAKRLSTVLEQGKARLLDSRFTSVQVRGKTLSLESIHIALAHTL